MAAKEFNAGTPVVIELEARRHRSAQDAPRGTMVTSLEWEQALDADRKALLLKLVVLVDGKTESADEAVFAAKCAVECEFQFLEPVPDEDLENNKLLGVLGGPLYQRAALQLQDIMWRMGYTAIRVPLYIDHETALAASKSIKQTGGGVDNPPKPRRPRKPKKVND